jgi:hypothetical protein
MVRSERPEPPYYAASFKLMLPCSQARSTYAPPPVGERLSFTDTIKLQCSNCTLTLCTWLTLSLKIQLTKLRKFSNFDQYQGYPSVTMVQWPEVTPHRSPG